MIDDMASLKQAMEQMDADDATVAQAAKDRAAQILSDAGLSFSKMADLIEQRRLLLRPRIVASIKRMDQPAMLGEAAFRDTHASLRKEGQSFRQIAEALELRAHSAPRYEAQVARPPLMAFEQEPNEPAEQTALPFILRTALYPLRNPIRVLVIAILAVVLVNIVHDFPGTIRPGRGLPSSDNTARRLAEASPSPAPPMPPAATPSGSPSDQPTPASPSTTPSSPPGATPSANGPAPAGSAADRTRMAGSRVIDDFMPDRLRRSSRSAGPCRGGIGGCYWGGGQY
jgi:hypothetical protein